ncbi:MAG: biotin synthase BioB [Planctomycetes bacterium]|nr:biotin synthase BioB [Planctomycetota bacterium]
MTAPITRKARRLDDGGLFDRKKLIGLTGLAGGDPYKLIGMANEVRGRHFGRAVRLCSIVPGKLGACGEDCKWCAQSARHAAKGGKPVTAPSVTPSEEIVKAARTAACSGVGSLGIINSGRRPSDAEVERVVKAVQMIAEKAAAGGVDEFDSQFGVCASLGAINADQAQRLAKAGILRYHHNLETSRAFFPKMVGTHGYQERLDTLKAARQAGMKICCGGIFGVGESWTDRVDLILTLRDEVGPDCVPLNFLHPIAGTPLAGATPLPPLECLCIIALFRLAMPKTDLLIGGGRVSNLRDMQSWVFFAGATTLMTGDYLTTSGRPAKQDIQMIRDLGLEIVKQF